LEVPFIPFVSYTRLFRFVGVKGGTGTGKLLSHCIIIHILLYIILSDFIFRVFITLLAFLRKDGWMYIGDETFVG
jgi:hypothetical protein